MPSCIPLRGFASFFLSTWMIVATLPPPPAFSAAGGTRIEMFAPQGVVKEILCAEGQAVSEGDVLVVLE